MPYHLPKYPKIWNLGHRNAPDLLKSGTLVVQEKIDGSQISFGKIEGELHIRTRRVDISETEPDKLFALAVKEIKRAEPLLIPGCIYRGEYLKSPRHNTLAYDRVPRGHIAIFDIEDSEGFYSHMSIGIECERLDFEQMPQLATVSLPSEITETTLNSWLNKTSCLGGQQVEGVVLKNYSVPSAFNPVTFCKFVRPEFQEANQNKIRAAEQDILSQIFAAYPQEPRWEKAVIHLEERDHLIHDPQDIGPLLKELQLDFEEEEEQTIRDMLYTHYRKQILKQMSQGFAEWYKLRLAKEVLS